jgi:hypothetical protein
MMRTEEYKRLTPIKIDGIATRNIMITELYLQLKSKK